MLGVVFTELLHMVEARHAQATPERIIERAGLSHGGAYTAVGSYPSEELERLLAALAEETGSTRTQLLESFGEYLFGRLAAAHPQLLAERPSLFDLLGHLDQTIHPQVQRLYPQAELPRFGVLQRDARRMLLRYDSPRRMASLAVGLIRGAAAMYGVDVSVQLETVSTSDPHVRLHVLHAS
jgi:hypothetical protein